MPNCLDCIYLVKQGAGRVPRRIGVSQANGVGKTICQCDFFLCMCVCLCASVRVHAWSCAFLCVCVCLRACTGKTICQCFDSHVTRRGSVSGDPAMRTPDYPLYAWFLYLTPATVTYVWYGWLASRGEIVLQQVRRVVRGTEKKKVFKVTRGAVV